MHGTQRHINTSQYDARYTQRQNKTEVKCLPVQSIWSAVRNRQVITISIRCTLFKMTTYNQFTLHFSTLYLSLTRLWQKDERSLSGKIESLKFSINFPPINLVSLTMPLNSSLSSCLLQTPTYYIRLYVGECQICALVTLFRLPVWSSLAGPYGEEENRSAGGCRSRSLGRPHCSVVTQSSVQSGMSIISFSNTKRLKLEGLDDNYGVRSSSTVS